MNYPSREGQKVRRISRLGDAVHPINDEYYIGIGIGEIAYVNYFPIFDYKGFPFFYARDKNGILSQCYTKDFEVIE